MDEADESVDAEFAREPIRPRYFPDMLRLFAPHGVEVRGEHAFSAAVRFLELLQTEVKDPEWQQTLLRAWLNAVKNRNFGRFQRDFRRWKRSLDVDPSVSDTNDG